MKDISVIIPARSEEFLRETIQDIVDHSEADTEIIALLDGEWSEPAIPQNDKVNIIYVPESIGQRGAAKLAARLADGKYIVKTDAHCTFDQGWDRKMLEAFEKSGDNVVMVPEMKNLHAYDWKCFKCGCRIYQDRAPKCPECGSKMKKKMLWRPRRGTHSFSYCFDSDPHFQYWNDYLHRDEYKQDLERDGITQSMSLQGSFFMCTREKYFSLDVDDDTMGSWGNQGLMVACKFWLSGGRVLVNHNTFYAHMFRTKSATFGFPYPQSGRGVQKTKAKIRNLFWKGKFDGQIYPLSWLIEKFWPIKGWSDEDLRNLKKGEKGLRDK